MKSTWIAIGFSLASLLGCASVDPAPGGSAGAEATPTPEAEPGLSREHALEVCDPGGERAYLDRLRCADGSVPTYSRRGSVGSRFPTETAAQEEAALEQTMERRPPAKGELDHHVLDLYELICPGRTYALLMDMYHCDQPPPAVAPAGLTLAGDSGE